MKSLTSKVSTRLKSVFASLAVIASSSLAANASIVYFNPADVIVSDPANSSVNTIYIDLPNGTASTTPGPSDSLYVVNAGAMMTFGIIPFGGLLWNNQPGWEGVDRLNAGTMIGPSGQLSYPNSWVGSPGNDGFGWSVGGGGAQSVTGYFGYKLEQTGIYGWAQLTVTLNQITSEKTVTLLDFAYQSSPGVGILAGDKGLGGGPSSVPEPGTLTLAAIGITGIVAARIRRNKKAAAA